MEDVKKTAKLTKGSPLLLLVIGLFIIGIVGGIAVSYWESSIVKKTIEYEVIGDNPVTITLDDARFVTVWDDSGSFAVAPSDKAAPAIMADSTLTVPLADLDWMTYDDPIPSLTDAGAARAMGNGLLLEFGFEQGSIPEGWGTYSSECQVVISLGT